MATQYHVLVSWDDEAKVWVAVSEDLPGASTRPVPGLVTEADSVEELLRKLEVLVPELLEENGEDTLSIQEYPVSVVLPFMAGKKDRDGAR
jgi:predicted RNase H-like HicB family nuclease